MTKKTIREYAAYAASCSVINSELYNKYDVKRGLRDLNGKGVVAGLTEISEINSNKIVDGVQVPCDGELYYRGINVEDLVDGFTSDNRFGFEETVFLLMFGHLPTSAEYEKFKSELGSLQQLPKGFMRDTVLDSPSKDIMNALSKSVLTLYSYDDNADDTSIENVVSQCLSLIARFPVLCVYAYQAYQHFYHHKSLVIHQPKPELSIAENTLRLLRPDKTYTQLEARLLDLALVLHAEHGGGNNSSFTTHVVTSSGTDTYSSTVASLGSLKGPRHGGANIKVVKMFDELKKEVNDWSDDNQIADYLEKLLNKKAFDKSGLIYGIGHAVYSLSDPRAGILKKYAKALAKEKNLENEFNLYEKVEQLAPEIIGKTRKIYKGVSANVDFYSGLVYKMLDLPEELFTPIFAIARMGGWSAHRIEEIVNSGKIIRPAYTAVVERKKYIPISER